MVKKYKDDGKYHASSVEHAVSKFKEFLENNEEIPRNVKPIICWVFEKSFTLGYRAGQEYYEQKHLEQINQLMDLDKDQLKTYAVLFETLSKFETEYDSENTED